MSTGALAATNLAQKLGDYFHAARFEELPRPVVDKAIEHISYNLIRGLQGAAHELGVQACNLARQLSDRGGAGERECDVTSHWRTS